MDNSRHRPHRPAADPGADHAAEPAGRPGETPEPSPATRPGAELAAPDLSGQVAELVGELSEDTSPSRRRRISAAIARLAQRSGRVTQYGVTSGSRWLTAQTLAMAPRLPVRDRATLRAQFPGLAPEELADALIQGSARASTAVGAAAGMAMVLPLPTAPVEVVVETLAVVGIEIKLVAELHEIYGMGASGSATERMMAYVSAWAHRRGVVLAPAGIVVAVGSPLRRRLQRRLLVRAGRSAVSIGPLLTGAAAGAALNRRETRRLGQEVREDLRRRSPATTRWPEDG